MDPDAIRAATQDQRLQLCDFLDELGPADWTTPSLCPSWDVNEVLAHLTIPTRATTYGVIAGMIRARGNFHRMTVRQARDRAARFSPGELVAQLRETAGSSRRMPGSSLMDPLVDILVHGQDIARPLGRHRPIPPVPAAEALTFVVTNKFYGAPDRLAQLTLVATDADWSSGVGVGAQEVRGSVADLLLMATGRLEGLSGLTGSGMPILRARFQVNT